MPLYHIVDYMSNYETQGLGNTLSEFLCLHFTSKLRSKLKENKTQEKL